MKAAGDDSLRGSPSFTPRRTLPVIAQYAVLALLVIPVFPHFSSPNEFTRWLLVASVAENHTIEVSSLAPLLGPGFEDLAVVGTRVYSNKAPGLALAAAPGYALARPFLGPPTIGTLRAALTAMRWFGATLPLLLMALLFAGAARERGAESAAFAVATLLFATPLFAYGLLLFSHALVAAALFAAWVLLYLRDRGGIVAGALIGIAVMSEYPVAVVAAVLIIGLAITRRCQAAPLVSACGQPSAIALALYQPAAFGRVLASPHTYEKLPAYRELAHTGLFGLHMIDPAIVARILFHPARGLLLFSPVLIPCLAAYRDARRALPRPAFVTLALAPLALFAVYGGYPNWHGGWNVGPRYITGLLPFVVFPLAFARIRWWTAALFGASACAVMLTTLVFPFVPLEFPLPWGSLAMPLLAHGLVAPNVLHPVSPTLAVALPLLAIVLAVAVATPRRLLVAGGAGVLIALGAGYAAMKSNAYRAMPFVERIYFEDTYFGRRGELDTIVRARIAAPSLLARRAAQLPYGPVEWPFGRTR